MGRGVRSARPGLELMPIYAFKCSFCCEELTTSRPMAAQTLTKTCPNCDLEAPRSWTPVAVFRFEEHFSPSIGKHVSSKRQYEQELKRAAEEQTARDGIPRNYVPVDLRDVKPSGEGTDEQARVHRAKGTPGWERKTSYF